MAGVSHRRPARRLPRVSEQTAERRHRLRRMEGRDPDEPHRAATPLELLFDLTFVVAFGIAGNELAHFLAEEHFAAGIGGFLFAMFAHRLGLDQLLLVRLGLRHRRLGLPAD